MADDTWPEAIQGDYDRGKYAPESGYVARPTPSGTVAGPDTQADVPAATGGFGRDVALATTSALGVPGDIINAGQPAINWIANRLGVPDTGPQIPIPTTEYVRGGFGVKPPAKGSQEEAAADIVGRGIGTTATYGAFPISRLNALSTGVGATLSGFSQEYFPDSWALQLLAGGVSGLATTSIARQVLSGGIRGIPGALANVGDVIGREIIGRVAGGLISSATGLPEYLSTELGGLAGAMSHRFGRGMVRNMLSLPGAKSTIMGTLGAIPGALETYRQSQQWPDATRESNTLVNPPSP